MIRLHSKDVPGASFVPMINCLIHQTVFSRLRESFFSITDFNRYSDTKRL
ncbi:hypothetical protein HM1_3033 [Heliomicrobium modesticaldum Ice1]|uniref:Uncharacterized protein n=1 Tax=Heliobacterium modesticaldum (strain ATCC 51547 / Ice1) TaxID=498761 RepID=B0TDL5_HELMI|nr:hypothetical protein HM1_3033 [Heliomicrobium modesticaldum Ice1]